MRFQQRPQVRHQRALPLHVLGRNIDDWIERESPLARRADFGGR